MTRAKGENYLGYALNTETSQHFVVRTVCDVRRIQTTILAVTAAAVRTVTNVERCQIAILCYAVNMTGLHRSGQRAYVRRPYKLKAKELATYRNT